MQCRYKIRVVCGRPYHALFMHNMLIRPTEEELASFGKPDFTIYNAGGFPANRSACNQGFLRGLEYERLQWQRKPLEFRDLRAVKIQR